MYDGGLLSGQPKGKNLKLFKNWLIFQHFRFSSIRLTQQFSNFLNLSENIFFEVRKVGLCGGNDAGNQSNGEYGGRIANNNRHESARCEEKKTNCFTNHLKMFLVYQLKKQL